MNKFFDSSKMSAADAQYEAQKIAFAPIIFQVARVMRTSGILELLQKHNDGLTLENIAETMDMSVYSVRVLLETSLSAKIVSIDENELYRSTKIGYFLLNDDMTKVNMDFNHFVNFKGLYELENSIKDGRACGLKEFTTDETIYPGLSKLPNDAKKAWFDFDHLYSDSAFSDAINVLNEYGIKKILEIGGNTGKFSRLFVSMVENSHITVVDLPGQIAVINKNIKDLGLELQIDTVPADMLDLNTELPSGYDGVWMSQFLDCFGENDIIRILQKAQKALNKNGKILILEPLWDRQKYETSAYCIINTSPYFTALANGTSKMFGYKELARYIQKAGLSITAVHDNLGFSHSLLICEKSESK